MKRRNAGNRSERLQSSRFAMREAIGEGAQPPARATHVALNDEGYLRADPPFNPAHGAEQIGLELHLRADRFASLLFTHAPAFQQDLLGFLERA